MDTLGNGEMESPTSRSSGSSGGKPIKMEADMPPQSPSSYSPAMSPYMHHYRTAYDRRPLRSPTLQDRASVLRDGSKAGRPQSPSPMSLAYRPASRSSLPQQPDADAALPDRFNDNDPQATALICPPSENSNADHLHRDPGCPEDLRMKMEPPATQDEPLSSTANTNNQVNSSGLSANGGLMTMYDAADSNNLSKDRDLIPTTLWNSVTNKLSKTGAITTPDGKKSKHILIYIWLFLYFFFRKEIEVPFLRTIIRVWDESASTHTTTASGNTSAVSILHAHVHPQQHRSPAHRAWTQNRIESESVPAGAQPVVRQWFASPRRAEGSQRGILTKNQTRAHKPTPRSRSWPPDVETLLSWHRN